MKTKSLLTCGVVLSTLLALSSAIAMICPSYTTLGTCTTPKGKVTTYVVSIRKYEDRYDVYKLNEAGGCTHVDMFRSHSNACYNMLGRCRYEWNGCR